MNVFWAITVCAAAVGANDEQLDSFRKTYLFADVWDGARASLTTVLVVMYNDQRI